MRLGLLLLTCLTGLALSQDRVEFDPSASDTGAEPTAAPIQPWPVSTQINQVQGTIQFEWPAGTPPETVAISEVSHAQRARAYDTAPDELFLVLLDGRKILLCQGAQVPKQVELVRAMTQKDVEALPIGEGHAKVPLSKPAAPTLRFRAGGSAVKVTHVGPIRAETAERRPAIEAGDGATVDGVRRMGKYQLDKYLKPKLPAVAQCFKTALLFKPDLAGKVIMGFVITAKGTAAAAFIQSTTLNNAQVENCIRAQVLTVKFPPTMTGQAVQVSYPFVFSVQ
jgi:hypothetical protein